MTYLGYSTEAENRTEAAQSIVSILDKITYRLLQMDTIKSFIAEM